MRKIRGHTRDRQIQIEQQFKQPIKELLNKLYWDKKLSAQSICEIIGVQPRTFLNWCKSLGIPLRSVAEGVALSWANEQIRQKHILGMNTPECKAKVRAKRPIVITPESHKRRSDAKKGVKNPMYAQYGSLNPNWKGGKITYRGAGWRGIVLQVKRRDGHKCTRCGTNRYLQVHHITPYRETKDNSLENLITLCATCHAIVENKTPNENPRVNQWG